MMTRLFTAALLAAALITPATADAKKEPKATPAPKVTPAAVNAEELVQAYVGSLRAGRYDEVGKLLDVEGCKRLQTQLVPVIKEAHTASPEAGLLKLFDGIETVEGLEKLTPAQFVAAFFGGVTKLNPIFKETLSSMTAKVIGTVPEGDGVIHVVCRITNTNAGMSITKVSVISLKKNDARWGVMLSSEIENMAEQVRRVLIGAPK
ncbi:MAG: hypothetical protein IT186_18305 [Acidobacteria bacterium]|nr:hypothetical protein [Acidobacteriota bacterium]MCK6683160.1 hypothetical protein [Thermoanaerobaculia bacterium]